MNRVRKLRSRALWASAASTLVLGALTPAYAQTAAANEEDATQVEEVVVTGTFLRGTPETAVIPVEGVNLEELRDQGSPSNMDFVKGLSEIGSVAGEANRANAFAIGAASINLRGLSSSRTVVVFNGRRFPEQYSFSVGRFNNINQIPNAAIGRVEVLKDGGATTYGADAVGGVVNYITRRNLDGVEFQAGYRYIDGSDGDYDASLSLGKVFDNFNIMGILGYAKRNELDLAERDWALRDYLTNPGSWTDRSNPGSYIFQNSFNTTFPTLSSNIRPGGSGTGLWSASNDLQVGPSGIVRDPACLALGGYAGFNSSASPVCYSQSGLVSNLVEEQETWQAYAEANYEFSPRFRIHGEFMYYGLDIPRIPIDNGGALVQAWPVGTNGQSNLSTAGGVTSFFYSVPNNNPAVAVLVDDMRNSNGTSIFTADQLTALASGGTGRVILPSSVWRPFQLGGNPISGETDFQHNFSNQYRYTLELAGDLGKFAGGTWDWSFAYTLNTLDYTLEFEDIPVNRLQAALNGLGGQNCTGSTPGANGCLWFNPFSSAVERNIFTGQANPYWTPAVANDPALVDWMYIPGEMHRESTYVIFDAILHGDLDYNLWTDEPIQVAVGGQYREIHEISDLSDFSDEFTNPCATPGQTNCSQSRAGPSVYRRGVFISGFTRDYDRRYPVVSAFGETKIPVTDDLSVQVSGRYEKFFSDLDATDNEVFVWQAAGRWQALPWLAFRATAGETFSQVNPPAPNDPISTNAVTIPTALFGAGTGTYNQLNYSNTAVEPETGLNYNLGLVFEVGDVTATIDYYNVKIDDLIRVQTANQLISALQQPGTNTINCSSPLLTQEIELLGNNEFVSLAGPCVDGASIQSALNGATVRIFGTQGQQTALVNGGTLETSGIDAGVNWRPSAQLFGGDVSLSGDVSYVLEYQQSPYVVAGIEVAPGFDGIGSFNELTGRNSQHIAQYRGNVTANYRKGRHNFNWTTRVVSSFINDDTSDFGATAATNANIGNSAGYVTPLATPCPTGPIYVTSDPAGAGTGLYGGYNTCQNAAVVSGMKIPTTFTSDFTYRIELPADTSVSLNVQNVFDQDPQFSRDQINYDAYTGSPLGRTFKVTFLKKWQ